MLVYDDELGDYLARQPPLVWLTCPGCGKQVHGLSEAHARNLLDIHRDGTCQRGGET